MIPKYRLLKLKIWWRRLVACSLIGFVSAAAADELPEYRLKAAVIYNFAAFTEWPESVGDTLHLCIYGPDPFGEEIDGLSGKRVGSRTLVIARKQSLEALQSCQIVFVSHVAINELQQVVTTLRTQPILTITDTPGATHQGAMLNMNIVDKRVQFEANLEAATKSTLSLSSKLLRLATEVLR